MSGNAPFTIQDRESLRRGSLVGQLLEFLPWQGELAALDFSFRDGMFTVELSASAEDDARAELQAFLAGHDIDSLDWLGGSGPHLVIDFT
jgi:hypothetical protein